MTKSNWKWSGQTFAFSPFIQELSNKDTFSVFQLGNFLATKRYKKKNTEQMNHIACEVARFLTSFHEHLPAQADIKYPTSGIPIKAWYGFRWRAAMQANTKALLLGIELKGNRAALRNTDTLE